MAAPSAQAQKFSQLEQGISAVGRQMGDQATSAAAVGYTTCASSTGTHRVRAALNQLAVLHYRQPSDVRASSQLGSDQPDRRSQPDGGSGVCSLGDGQRSDIPHVLQ